MKKLYTLTITAILLISSNQLLQAIYIKYNRTLTTINTTSEPIWVHLKASHKNKANQTRHDEETFQLAPSGGTKDFVYAANTSTGLQLMDIYNYDPKKPAPKQNAIHTLIKADNDSFKFSINGRTAVIREGKIGIIKNPQGTDYVLSNATGVA